TRPRGAVDRPGLGAWHRGRDRSTLEFRLRRPGCGAVSERSSMSGCACAMVLLLRYTALRIGDVAMLTRDRISLDGGRWRIFLRTEKSGQPVFLPVPPDLKSALEAAPPPISNIDSRYFFWNGNGKPKTHEAHIDRCLRAVCNASGVKGAHAHRFRHSL